jgi:hypothetical protein
VLTGTRLPRLDDDMPQGSVNDFEGAHIPHLDPIIPAEPLETTNMVAAPIVQNNTCLPRSGAAH